MRYLKDEIAKTEWDAQSKHSLITQQYAWLKRLAKRNITSPKAFALAFLGGTLISYLRAKPADKNNTASKSAKPVSLVSRLFGLLPKTLLLQRLLSK